MKETMRAMWLQMRSTKQGELLQKLTDAKTPEEQTKVLSDAQALGFLHALVQIQIDSVQAMG